MNKGRRPEALLMLFVIISVFTLAFTGCQSKKQASQNQSNGQFMQDRTNAIKDNVQALVTDGTINQGQADKIIEALTVNRQGFQGQRPQQNGQQNNQQSGQSNNGQQAPPTDGQNNGQGQRQNMQRPNLLEKLVTDGTITQEQADIVMQKAMAGFGRGQGRGPAQGQGQNQGQSQGSSTNN